MNVYYLIPGKDRVKSSTLRFVRPCTTGNKYYEILKHSKTVSIITTISTSDVCMIELTEHLCVKVLCP